MTVHELIDKLESLGPAALEHEVGVYDLDTDTELTIERVENDDGPVLKVRTA